MPDVPDSTLPTARLNIDTLDECVNDPGPVTTRTGKQILSLAQIEALYPYVLEEAPIDGWVHARQNDQWVRYAQVNYTNACGDPNMECGDPTASCGEYDGLV